MIPTPFPPETPDPDARLRILWIEDDASITKMDTLGPAFDETVQIVIVASPTEAYALLRENQYVGLLRDGFDAYITDFRLSDRARRENQTSVDDPSITDFPAKDEKLDDQNLGLLAPAAGFLLGVLFSFHFPARPNVILPYSGHASEFGDVWNLVRHFAPPTTKIVKANYLNKVKLGQVEVIREASAQFREAIIEWAKDGRLLLRCEELRDALSRAKEGSVPLETPILLIAGKTARAMKAGALFLDKGITKRRGIPEQDVRVFLDSIPAQSPEYLSACKIADTYIKAAENELAVALYSSTYEALDDDSTAKTKTTAAKKAARMPTNMAWLGTRGSEASNDVDRRNAFLILLVYIHGKYFLPFDLLEEIADEEILLSVAIERLRRRHKLDQFPVVDTGFEHLVGAFELDLQDLLSTALDALNFPGLNLKSERKATFMRLIQQYVDPGPSDASEIRPEIRAEGRIGVGLRRLLDASRDLARAEPRSQRRLQNILDGKPCLDATSLVVARAYARETLPPSCAWPRWLEPTSPSASVPTEPSSPDAAGPAEPKQQS
jgi:hypothetical protein